MEFDYDSVDLEQIDQFIVQAETAMENTELNLYQLMKLNELCTEQNTIVKDSIRRLDHENVALRNDLKASAFTTTAQTAEMKMMFCNLRQLQQERAKLLENYKIDAVTQAEVAKLQYEVNKFPILVNQLVLQCHLCMP
jgi:hypothetical protein